MICLIGIIERGESSASGQKMNWNGYGSIYHQVNFFKENYPYFLIEVVAPYIKNLKINDICENKINEKYIK